MSNHCPHMHIAKSVLHLPLVSGLNCVHTQHTYTRFLSEQSNNFHFVFVQLFRCAFHYFYIQKLWSKYVDVCVVCHSACSIKWPKQPTKIDWKHKENQINRMNKKFVHFGLYDGIWPILNRFSFSNSIHSPWYTYFWTDNPFMEYKIDSYYIETWFYRFNWLNH